MERVKPPRPRSPKWDTQRPYLTGAFLQTPSDIQPTPLTTFPQSTQHKLAAEDALNALLALRPTYATLTPSPPQYSVQSLDSSHPEIPALLSRILPLATDHAHVKVFVEASRLPHHTGHVNQAVAVALNTLLNDYHEFILRLEQSLQRNELPLQRLLYYVQPASRSMTLLRDITQALQSKSGGAALGALYNLAVTHVGSQDAQSVLAYILSRAAAPIFDAMHFWLLKGVVHDPHDEFFIVHNHRVANQNSWHARYTVNWDHLPPFLHPFIEKLLRAGKYLNVLRQCGVDTDTAIENVANPVGAQHDDLRLVAEDLLATDAPRRIGRLIDRSYTLSSSALMDYLKKTVRIRDRLRCLRRFFLLQQGDYLVHFFDAAEQELAKPRKQVSKSKLASLLDLSIRTSVSASDPFQDDLSCILCTEDIATQISAIASATAEDVDTSHKAGALQSITGYEAFALDYKLHWPVSLIVTEMDVLKYQFMFRYLFYCKYVERELEDCWVIHCQSKGALRIMPSSFVRSFALRNRMIQFIRNMLYYTVADVLEPNWRTLETAMRKAETIDEIMQHHNAFLDHSVNQSLLSNEKHLRVFKNISETCITFAAYTGNFSKLFTMNEPADVVEEKLQTRNYPATLAKFETSFDMHLGKLLDGLSTVSKKGADVHLANLCERLDIGGYYGRYRERSLASLGSLAI